MIFSVCFGLIEIVVALLAALVLALHRCCGLAADSRKDDTC
jgi:hypothetical protein